MDNQHYETYELVLKDQEDEVFALSLVSEPAIQQDFVFFGEEKEIIKFAAVDEDQHTIVGPILIPNMKILRMKDDGTPYYVTFSADTVKQVAQKYIQDNHANDMTIEHERPISDVSLVESWIAESSVYDKAKNYGLSVKPGTWLGVFKVNNPDIWNNYVKTGKVKGISLEGLFSHVLIKASAIDETIFEKDITQLNDVEAAKVLERIKHLIKEDNRYNKGQRIDIYEMDGEGGAQPSIPNSSYAGQFGPGKKKKKNAGEYIHPALIGTKK